MNAYAARDVGRRLHPDLGNAATVFTLLALIMVGQPRNMLIDSHIGYSSWAKVWLADLDL